MAYKQLRLKVVFVVIIGAMFLTFFVMRKITLSRGVSFSRDSVCLNDIGMRFKKINPSVYGYELPDFYLQETEVTNEMYKKYLIATGQFRDDTSMREAIHKRRAELSKIFSETNGDTSMWEDLVANENLLWTNNTYDPKQKDYPVVFVSARDAEKFCEWLSIKYPEAGKFRLPFSDEWFIAAYGNRKYPWGNKCHLSWFHNSGDPMLTRIDGPIPRQKEPEPVKSREKGKTPEGLYGMRGNVHEYVEYRESKYTPETNKDLRQFRMPIIFEFICMGGGYKEFNDTPGTEYTVPPFNPRREMSFIVYIPTMKWDDVGFRVLLERK